MADTGRSTGTRPAAHRQLTQALWSVLRRLLRHVGAALLACLAVQAHALTLELTDAQAQVTIEGLTTQQTVRLPYHWDSIHQGQQGKATFEVRFALLELPDKPYGLYVSRLGTAYEIWLNGVLLQRNGDLLNFDGADYAKLPRAADISPALLRAENVLRVLIRADKGRHGGLAPLVLGPINEVQRLYHLDYLRSHTGSMVVVIVSLMAGVLALALWATQLAPVAPGLQARRPVRDRLYLLAAVAELSWTMFVADDLLDNPPFAWPWWGVINIALGAVWALMMLQFAIEVAGWRERPVVLWLGRWIVLLLVMNPFATGAALLYGHPLALTLWHAALAGTCLALVPAFLYKAVRNASVAHRVVAAALLLNTLVGLHDLYAYRVDPGYGGIGLLRYSSVFFGLALAFVVISRLRSASAQVRDLLASMDTQLRDKEAALQVSYQRVAGLAREQARADERTRILRDMHDGVGSHISTAIRQLQSGRADDAEVLHTLRDSLDHLKLSIDAMNVPPGDITALLANVRYRLEPRFLACDIRLAWDVDLLEPVASMDASAMAQLQFMLFEALSNVLQHANASTLRIHAHACETPASGVRLQIIDDGCGFDASLPRGSGLSSMQERARSIGAGLYLSSAPGRTVVEITLGSVRSE
jgi:signal transduction histidine kinase